MGERRGGVRGGPGGWSVRVAAGEDRGAWRAAVARLEEGPGPGAALIKAEESARVWAGPVRLGAGTRDVVVKRWAGRGPLDRLKVIIGLGQLSRQWRGAAWLAGHGFAAARPLALATRRWSGPAMQVLVMERVPGPTVLAWHARARRRGARRLGVARALGALAARMAVAGRWNRDFKPSNLVLEGGQAGAPRIVQLDTVAIRRTRARDHALERMLASLVIEPTGTGHPPGRNVCLAAVLAAARALDPGAPPERGRAAARRLWRRVARRVEAHGDPRPAVDPLGWDDQQRRRAAAE